MTQQAKIPTSLGTVTPTHERKTQQLALIEEQLTAAPRVEGTAPTRRSGRARGRAPAATALTRAPRGTVTGEAPRRHVPATVMQPEVPDGTHLSTSLDSSTGKGK